MRRHRPRQARLAAAVGVGLACCTLVLTGCTGGSDNTAPTPPDETGDDGGAVIDEFVAAWEKPSVSAFRGVVDEPGVAAHDISAHVAEL